jgi:NAD(P)-dependent dehydrogenase (short-subunit alcohol dehydrogenase family)
MKLEGQVAVVTGGGRNIGEEVAKLFAAEGASVAIIDLDRMRGARVADAIMAAGGQAMALVADVSKGEEVAAAVTEVVARFGRIDILVNNVAISDNKTILDITEAEWDRVMAVTLKSQFLMAQAAARQMIAQGPGGRIVNIGSTSGHRGRSRAVAYSAAKGGVANLNRAMAVQLAPHGIRVNSISPNKTGSPVGREEFDPTRPITNLVKRPGQPQETARAVLFLASDDASFILGENIFVDGGVMAMEVP